MNGMTCKNAIIRVQLMGLKNSAMLAIFSKADFFTFSVDPNTTVINQIITELR